MTEPGLAGRSAWVLTEGHAGMEGPARALAEALGLDATVKRVRAPGAWGWLPAPLWPRRLALEGGRGDRLDPPWPDLLIACGRRRVAPALAVREASRRTGGPGTFTVYVQDPRIDPARFDLVIAPAHDRVAGANVVACLGSLNGLTPERLDAAAEAARARFATLPRPLAAVLVGGPSRAYRMGGAEMRVLGERLAALDRATGCGLAAVPSRRTGAANLAALRGSLAGSGAYLWDGTGDNPYLGLLALADALIVTCDSVNMTTEAAATGKPVYVAMFEGRSARFEAFHGAMRANGHTRPFEGRIDFAWRPAPLRETERVAAEVARRYRAARGSASLP
jgi:hypothetical protein